MFKKKVLLVSCLLVGGLYLITPNLGADDFNSYYDPQFPRVAEKQDSSSNLALKFINHDPILIDGNENFTDTAIAEGWSGDGSLSRPYIIEGLNIDSSPRGTSISISNTDRYFEILNCLLSGEAGIYLSNVKNGAIINNTLKNALGGNNERSGIAITHESSYNTVTNNTFFNIEFPLVVNGYVNLIEYNQLYDNINGIFVRGNNNTISNNTVQDAGGGFGLEIGNSDSNTISHNLLIQNNGGINLENSNNSKIIGNIIVNNYVGAFFDLKSTNNLVTMNIFQSNPAQAVDNGISNTFDHNFWNEWTSPDNDVNGIVDAIYLIEGSAGNTDPSPLVSGDQIDSLHILSFPTLIQPREGESLNETSMKHLH
jgi:parallel beta-helix repeat protein